MPQFEGIDDEIILIKTSLWSEKVLDGERGREREKKRETRRSGAGNNRVALMPGVNRSHLITYHTGSLTSAISDPGATFDN